MAEIATIARPYAEALFKASASDLQGAGAWLEQVAAIADQPQLQQFADNPKATPEQRKQAETSLQALSGRQQQANRFTVVPGGQEWDATAGAMRNVPARVLDNQSGQFVQDQVAGAQQPQQRTVGQVFTDANGKKAKWDGQKYVPL